jgi:hypothetical protein
MNKPILIISKSDSYKYYLDKALPDSKYRSTEKMIVSCDDKQYIIYYDFVFEFKIVTPPSDSSAADITGAAINNNIEVIPKGLKLIQLKSGPPRILPKIIPADIEKRIVEFCHTDFTKTTFD